MKTTLKKPIVAFVLIGIVAMAAIGIGSHVTAQPTNNDDNNSNGNGRYKLFVENASGGGVASPLVIDTKTGRIWSGVYSLNTGKLLFDSAVYRSIDSKLSLVPNETAKDIVYTTNASGNLFLPQPN